MLFASPLLFHSSLSCPRVRAAVTWVTPVVTAVLMLFLASRQKCVTGLCWSFLPPLHLSPMSTHPPVPSHNPSVHRATSITHTIQCKAIIITIIIIICKPLRYLQSLIYPPKMVATCKKKKRHCHMHVLNSNQISSALKFPK